MLVSPCIVTYVWRVFDLFAAQIDLSIKGLISLASSLGYRIGWWQLHGFCSWLDGVVYFESNLSEDVIYFVYLKSGRQNSSPLSGKGFYRHLAFYRTFLSKCDLL